MNHLKSNPTPGGRKSQYSKTGTLGQGARYTRESFAFGCMRSTQAGRDRKGSRCPYRDLVPLLTASLSRPEGREEPTIKILSGGCIVRPGGHGAPTEPHSHQDSKSPLRGDHLERAKTACFSLFDCLVAFLFFCCYSKPW